jgi:hypothetical protein
MNRALDALAFALWIIDGKYSGCFDSSGPSEEQLLRGLHDAVFYAYECAAGVETEMPIALQQRIAAVHAGMAIEEARMASKS